MSLEGKGESDQVKQFPYTVKDPLGLHARPAGLLVQTARGLDSTVAIIKGGTAVEATRIIALMTLGVRQGDQITMTVQGGDEERSIAVLERFFRENL